jgi:rod shape-determining protein MreD
VKLPAPRLGLWGVLLLLVFAQVVLRPRYLSSPYAPDFVLIALLFFAIRSRPGAGAVAGFIVGLLTDALAPGGFGASAFALTIVGYLAGWLKALVFPDNLLVNALLVFVASWLRDALEMAVSSTLRSGDLGTRLLVTSPLNALSTAAAAVVVLLLFRPWLRAAPAL